MYVATCTLSALALTFGLLSLNVDAIAERVQAQLPARRISGFVILVAVGLGGFYSALSLRYVATGALPPMIEAVGLYTNLIAALDLSMVVPVGLLAGVWLWQRRP